MNYSLYYLYSTLLSRNLAVAVAIAQWHALRREAFVCDEGILLVQTSSIKPYYIERIKVAVEECKKTIEACKARCNAAKQPGQNGPFAAPGG
jgi:hypothetical protein